MDKNNFKKGSLIGFSFGIVGLACKYFFDKGKATGHYNGRKEGCNTASENFKHKYEELSKKMEDLINELSNKVNNLENERNEKNETIKKYNNLIKEYEYFIENVSSSDKDIFISSVETTKKRMDYCIYLYSR